MWWIGLTFPAAHLGVVFLLIRNDRGLSISELIALLDARGYRCAPDTYARMEAGLASPADGERFLLAYGAALKLTRMERRIVVTQWAYDVLCTYFDEQGARDVLHRSIGQVVKLISSKGSPGDVMIT